MHRCGAGNSLMRIPYPVYKYDDDTILCFSILILIFTCKTTSSTHIEVGILSFLLCRYKQRLFCFLKLFLTFYYTSLLYVIHSSMLIGHGLGGHNILQFCCIFGHLLCCYAILNKFFMYCWWCDNIQSLPFSTSAYYSAPVQYRMFSNLL